MPDDTFELTEPELGVEDVLVLDDNHFTPQSVAVVTGAASGIGQATAVGLTTNGLTVVGADVDTAGLKETSEQITDIGARGDFVTATTDLTDESDVTAMIDVAAEHGDLRYVANIAGMQYIASIPTFPIDQYDQLVDVMLRAPFLTAKFAIPHIRETDDGIGAIGNMSSVHGHFATKDKAAYITAKHGLHGLTRSIAAEGNGTLRGFSVSAGYVLTPLMIDQIEDTARERGISEQAVVEDVMLGQARLKEMMTPVEVANLFIFGFSHHAKHLNGGDLLWDGGYTTTYV